MRYKTYRVTEAEANCLETYITFNIATARQLGCSLIKFEFEKSLNEKLLLNLKKRLKQLKKSAALDTFIFSFDFNTQTTALNYLRNKFSEFAIESAPNDEVTLYVKL